MTLALLLAGCGSGSGGSGSPDSGIRDAGTVAFEIAPDWDTGEEGDEHLLALQDEGAVRPHLLVVKNGDYLRVIFTSDLGEESEVALDISQWSRGEAHSIDATWGGGSISLYVDGENVGSSSYAGSVEIPPGTPLVLGSDAPEGSEDAVIRDFEVFRRPLDESGIDGVQSGV